jgi:hypothetical protein
MRHSLDILVAETNRQSAEIIRLKSLLLGAKASFFQTCERDEAGHCKPSGQGGAGGGGSTAAVSPGGLGRGNAAEAGGSGAQTAPPGDRESKLAQDVAELEKTPEGQAAISRGKVIAEKAKEGIKKGVEAALSALDEESRGGISLIAGGLASGDAGAMTAGASSLFNAVFTNVYEEIFELALSQHSMPGAHAVGMVASTAAAKLETGLLKAVAWAWGRATGTKSYPMYGVKSMGELTEGDKKLLAAMAEVAANAVRQILSAAGSEGAEVDKERMAEKIAASLRGESDSPAGPVEQAEENAKAAKRLSQRINKEI